VAQNYWPILAQFNWPLTKGVFNGEKLATSGFDLTKYERLKVTLLNKKIKY